MAVTKATAKKIALNAIKFNSRISALATKLEDYKSSLRDYAEANSPTREMVEIATRLGVVKIVFQDIKATVSKGNLKKLPVLRETAGDDVFFSVFDERAVYTAKSNNQIEALKDLVGDDIFNSVFETAVEYELRGTAADTIHTLAMMDGELRPLFDQVIKIGSAAPSVKIPVVDLEKIEEDSK
jgi:hypothetical protein